MNRQKTKDLLIKHEGLKLRPYRCTAGKLTIGVGRNLDDVGISELEAMQMLDHDIDECVHDLAGLFGGWYHLSDTRQAVLVDMRFNLGAGGFRKFKNVIRAVNDSDFCEAAREMLNSRWADQVGQRADELVHLMVVG